MDIVERLRRMNSAMRRCVVPVSKWPTHLVRTPKYRFVEANFSGDASPEELANDAFSLIANVASLADHLRKWSKENNRDPRRVDETIRCSRDLRIVVDLWNRDKHGGDRNYRGRSGLEPRLENLERALRMRTQPKKGSSVIVQQGLDGRFHSRGDGTATIDTSGTVYDKHGRQVGDLQDILATAVQALETLLVTYEIGRGITGN